MRNVLISVMTIAMACSTGFAQIIMQPANNNNTNDNDQRALARRAAVQAAQGEVDRAQAMLEVTTARIRANFKANPDMLAAERDLTIKQAAFDKARSPLVEKLKKDPAYQEAMTRAQSADSRVKMDQAVGSLRDPASRPATRPATLPAPTDAQVSAATEKLEQKSALREMESAAIAADPTASQAQIELDAAREKIKMLNLQFDAAKLNDPEYKASLDQLNSAKSRLTAAAGQY